MNKEGEQISLEQLDLEKITESKKEKIPRLNSFESRIIQMIKDENKLQYGELPNDHYTNIYINELAKKIHQKDGFPIKIKILPQWNENNACVLKDGTIFVSQKLIDLVEYEEELLGVIAHEYVHYYRKHMEQEKDITDFSDILARIGQERKGEYEADLRAALELLDDSGINPLGFKMFLEKAHSKEHTNYQDIIQRSTHGSIKDRILNISSTTYFYHFSSINTELNPISEQFKKSLKDYPQSIFSDLYFRPATFFSGEELKEKNKIRMLAIDEIPVKQIPIVIKEVFHYIRAKSDRKYDPNDEIVLEKLIKRFENEITKKDLNEEDKLFFNIISLELFCDLPILSDKKRILKNEKEKFLDSINNPQNLEQLRIILEKNISSIELDYSLSNTTNFIIELANIIIDKKIFGDFEGDSSLIKNEELLSFIRNWAKTINEFNNIFGTEEGINSEKLTVRIANILLFKVENEKCHSHLSALFKKEFGEDKEYNRKIENRLETEYFSETKQVADILRKYHSFENVEQIIQQSYPIIAKMCKGKNLEEIFNNLFIFYKAANLEKFDKSQVYEDKISQTEGIFIQYGLEYLIFRSFNDLINKLPQFKKFSEKTKRLIKYSIAQQLQLNNILLEFEEYGEMADYDVDYFGDYSIRRDVLAAQLKPMPQKMIRFLRKTLNGDFLFEKSPTQKEIIENHYYLLSKEFERQHSIITKFVAPFLTTLRSGLTGEDNLKNTFVENFIFYIKNKSLKEIMKEIEYFENQNIKIKDLLAKNSEHNGLIISKYVDYLKQKQESKELNLESLIEITDWVGNPFLKLLTQRYLKKIFWDKLNFDEKLELVLPKKGKAKFLDFQIYDDFFENNVNNQEEYNKFKERKESLLDEFLTGMQEKTGLVTLLDSMNFRGIDMNELLSSLIESANNDRKLKNLIYEDLISTFTYSFLGINGETKDDIAGDSTIESVKNKMQAADKIIRMIYNLDYLGKLVLLRKVLASEYGVLPNEDKRKIFLQQMFEKTVKKDDEQLTNILEDIILAIGKLEEWELIYFALQNYLAKIIASPPKQTTPWYDFYEIENDFESAGGDIDEFRVFSERVVWKEIPADAQKRPWKYKNQYMDYSENKLADFLRKEKVVDEPQREKYSSIKFIKEIATQAGAIGVRFLQLLPQFSDISLMYRDEFNEVYDSIRGQSKLSSLALIEREWPHIWGEIEKINKRIGGGSIVTVYEAVNKNGSKEVIKVQNPNIKYHLDNYHRFISLVIDNLIKDKGKEFEVIKTALDDVKKWIDADVSFEHFLKDDAEFKNNNHGYKPSNFDYSIIIPQSLGFENPYYSREEFIEGKNLTKWNDLVQERHDFKQIISLITKSYFNQINKGLVHSDVHIGNFRVTPDKKVAILDRNFFLRLDAQDKSLVINLFNPLIPPFLKASQIVNYLDTVEKISDKEKAQKIVQNSLIEVQKGNWNEINTMIVKLREMKIKIPIKITLLIKNLNSLQLMAKKAGFENLTQAFLYSNR